MFRRGYIPGRFNKLGEFRVSDIMRIHPKTLDLNEVSGPLVGKTLLVIGSHQKRASGDPDHCRRRLPVNMTPGRLIRIGAGSIWARDRSAGNQQYRGNAKTAK